MMKSRHICPVCGGVRFITTAHVMQEWMVDENGNFIDVVDESVQVTHEPDDDNLWKCAECGAEAIIDKEEPETKEVQIQRVERILELKSDIASLQHRHEKDISKLKSTLGALRAINAKAGIEEVEAAISAKQEKYSADLQEKTTLLHSLEEKNHLCLVCKGEGRVLRFRSCAEDDRPDPNDPRDYVVCSRCHGSGREPKNR